MKPIKISSCPTCSPNTWEILKPAKGVYQCACGLIVTQILKRKSKIK